MKHWTNILLLNDRGNVIHLEYQSLFGVLEFITANHDIVNYCFLL